MIQFDNCNIHIYIMSQSVSVNDESYDFSFSTPSHLPQNLNMILWDSPSNVYGYMPIGGKLTSLECTQENFDKWVQPFVDLWQAEKDRVEAEQEAAKQELLKFENRKERALDTIQADYEVVLARGFVRTSLGFDADISPDSSATLMGTQINLVNIMRTRADGETPKTVFRDFYGLKRELDVVQVERLICEINGAQNYIRELKYQFKGAVKDTHDNESLNACIETCVYSTLDYSNLDETGNPSVLPFVETQSLKDRIDTF